jgi:hypothetical protein
MPAQPQSGTLCSPAQNLGPKACGFIAGEDNTPGATGGSAAILGLMKSPLLALCLGLLFGAPLAAEELPAADFLAAAPACPEEIAFCFGLELHIVGKEAGPVQTPEWVAAQISEANRHFAPLEVAFTLAGVSALPTDKARVETREDRDRLGRKLYSRGKIHLFLVEELANVDEPGKLNGVHWRDQAKKSRRWIILSSTAYPITLAHELGHFFGLPHSSYPISIMNKSPREEPPFEERTFDPEELEVMAAGLRRMVKGRELVAWAGR